MDIAYDHVQEETLVAGEEQQSQREGGLNSEFQQAFQAVQSSPWGNTLGGWISQARKQGETLASEAQEQATKGWGSLREQVAQRARGVSVNAESAAGAGVTSGEATTLGAKLEDGNKTAETGRSDNLPADIVKEAGTLVASLRLTAAAKLKDLQAAEDAADEALMKFGLNVRNFLRDAVVITAPTDDDEHKPRGTDGVGNEVLFETQEPGTGKKIFHTSRLDAQLHAIHTNASSFTEDPSQGAEWVAWHRGFDTEKQTDTIAQDVEKYEELRRAMEKLVPEKVEYRIFWTRYYFLRKAIDVEEKRRREVLKGAASTEEEVTWDDEDEDEQQASTPNPSQKPHNESTTTLNATPSNSTLLLPRRSHEDNKSVADSEASYDIVSGATSRAPNSPKEDKKGGESDDDWE